MVVIIETHTEPINPPSASPILTHAQFWDGIVYGLRNNHLLVPTINAAKVLSHTDEELVLLQTLGEHPTLGHHPGEHKNRFTLSPPSKVYKPCSTETRLQPFCSPIDANAIHVVRWCRGQYHRFSLYRHYRSRPRRWKRFVFHNQL